MINTESEKINLKASPILVDQVARFSNPETIQSHSSVSEVELTAKTTSMRIKSIKVNQIQSKTV